MKTIKEHQDAIVRDARNMVECYTTIFDLKRQMLEEHICPRCGEHIRCHGSDGSWCLECDLHITDWEYGEIMDDKKGIMKRLLKKKDTRTNK